MVINVDLSVNGIQKAITQIETFEKDLNKKANEIIKRLADIGLDEARIRFSDAIYDGTNKVKCEVNPTKDGYKLIASGKTVAFIEFGAGVTHQQPYPLPKPPGIVPIGTYGNGYGKRKGWSYKGETGTRGVPLKNGRIYTEGNPPNMCMYHALKEMEKNVEKIAREVFND